MRCLRLGGAGDTCNVHAHVMRCVRLGGDACIHVHVHVHVVVEICCGKNSMLCGG